MLAQFEREVNTLVPEAIRFYLTEDVTFIIPQGESTTGRNNSNSTFSQG
jgi:hypothetical protein